MEKQLTDYSRGMWLERQALVHVGTRWYTLVHRRWCLWVEEDAFQMRWGHVTKTAEPNGRMWQNATHHTTREWHGLAEAASRSKWQGLGAVPVTKAATDGG